MALHRAKTTVAGLEIVPGVFRVAPASRGFLCHVLGFIAGLSVSAFILSLIHVQHMKEIGLERFTRGDKLEVAIIGLVACGIFMISLMLVSVAGESGGLNSGQVRATQFLKGTLQSMRGVNWGGVLRIAVGLLSLIVPKRSREYLVGDLQEEFKAIAEQRGYFCASRWWFVQFLGILGSYAYRRVRRILGLESLRGWRRR